MKILINLDKILLQNDIVIKINSTEVPIYLENKNIILDVPLNFGLHQLVIINKTNQRFAINRVETDGSSLRHLIYLAWSSTNKQKKIQPCNELWEKDQTWTLPFGYPLSHWMDIVSKKFPASIFGKNLYESYWIWYPQSIILDKNIPGIVRDFFQYNFDFTVIDKKNYNVSQIPYFNFERGIDKKLISEAYDEVKNKIDTIRDLSKQTTQQNENRQEYLINDNQEWKVFQLLYNKGPQMHREIFPACWRLIDSILGKGFNVYNAIIGLLPPGGIVYPHMDYPYKAWPQIYIPLHWPIGNYIKIAGAGIPDVQSNITVINNDSFVHSVVNTSNENRFVMSLHTSKDNWSVVDISDQ